MQITFNVKFSSSWGQQVYIVGNCDELGNDKEKNGIALLFVNDTVWTTQVEMAVENEQIIRYRYFVMNEDGTKKFSAIQYQLAVVPNKTAQLVTIDEWVNTNHPATPFLSKPFEEIFYKRKNTVPKPKKTLPQYTFSIKAPQLEPSQTICIVGSHEKLGNWSTENPKLLSSYKGNFVCEINLSENGLLFYKYGIYDTKLKQFIGFEDGENRVISLERKKSESIFINDGIVKTAMKHWRGAGVAIPVFSLRTKNSFGVGEFTDLKNLADWCKKIDFKLIQLLPINDTIVDKTNADSYPYAANSSFALHPLYINLKAVGTLPDDHKYEKLYTKKQRKLNKLEVLDYESVIKFKLAYLKELFLVDTDFLTSEDYLQFFNLNKEWLEPYAAYCFLRDKYKTVDFSKWLTYGDATNGKWKKLVEPQSKVYQEIAFWYFVQFHLHIQITGSIEYCHALGIALKGDLPIGIGRTSCDAWQHPELFNMDLQSGAPPDDFAVKGQNWSFPTYNWEAMAQNGFDWWRKRFKKMSDYFDAFRIDHILGFFRIWSIPMDAVEGIMGHFKPAIPVHISEFTDRGINLEVDKFTKPHFAPAYLHELFQDNAFNVLETFFDFKEGKHIFKPEFDSQRKIEHFFSNSTIFAQDIKLTLFDCISNVILFPETENDQEFFHFNFAMGKTHTFNQLNKYHQNSLQQIYINYFYERQDTFWKKEAYRKLPSLQQSTDMLICGEDLGMVPDCVPEVMQSLSMLSLEVQRMPKASSSKFVNLDLVPYLSVATPSTHDMSTIRGWWEEDRNNTQAYYNNVLDHFGEAPQYCEPWIVKDIIKRHLQSPGMLCIFQLQDLMATNPKARTENPDDERINFPADPNHYWCYRMHIKLEDLLKEREWNNEMKEMVQQANRS